MLIDDTGSVEGIHAFIYCTKLRSGQVSPMPHSLTTLKDRATQLLIKYKSGALVTQLENELVCQLAVDVYGHIGSIDGSFGFLGDSEGG